ncbi:MAG TPA: hypothetical protein VGC36_07720 [Rhizomicrobium sp.]
MSRMAKSTFELVAPLTAEALEARCRAKGIRMGRTRRVVARVVAETGGCFDFDAVFDRARRIAPQISRGTIYLSLRRFQFAGLIRTPGVKAAAKPSGTQHV